ncbi:Aste57867_18799 [Aphanomyces stellatus]|uniref:Carbonic anhydrase n=1 Tax=Aphanomyces stellatus TaxID=120398 RepID=A0A485LB15_9STRA|nr:hypothetical protein As57867_018735 [Aphanomyces stellatus]VFT95533.1 Aste57867_18799 [Aphanomyces stellatus]
MEPALPPVPITIHQNEVPLTDEEDAGASGRRVSLSSGKKGLYELLERNRIWSDRVMAEEPYFFEKLAKQQTPQVLWIGCSDARVPPNQILDLKPGEVFVHKNLANEVVHSDLNCLSVIDYAVNQLKVKHIVVCGHYGCSGVKAAMGQEELGIVDNWIRNIKDLYIDQRKKVKGLSNDEMFDLLTEKNVAKSVCNVAHTRIVQNAWKRGQKLDVHGWCYNSEDGLIRDLNICMTSEDDVVPIYRRMAEKRSSIVGAGVVHDG